MLYRPIRKGQLKSNQGRGQSKTSYLICRTQASKKRRGHDNVRKTGPKATTSGDL